MKKPVSLLLAAALLFAPLTPSASATAYNAKPKLLVILVLDQFRGDYLDRFRADFKTPNGFNLFLQRGAYFPDCYYDYANTETAPGHSTIGTGAYSNGHNIGVNDWWDLGRSTTHMVSSVEDADYPLVGAPSGAELGASPQTEHALTLGDEVVLSTGGKARLFGVSLKDRAAILTSGHASQGAYWIDHATGQFETSTYWRTELPQWVKDFNATEMEKARKEAGIPTGNFYETVGATQTGVRYELEFAEALIAAEKLGQHDTTDVLTISISSTDILGHKVGPDSPQQRAMIDGVDVELNSFFNYLQAHVDGGLGSVWASLTGDHGVAPSPSVAASEGVPAASFSYADVVAELNRELNAKFATAQPVKFVLGGEMPYVQLDASAFAQTKLSEAEAESLVATLLPGALDATQTELLKAKPDSHALRPAKVQAVYTRSQIAVGDVPNNEEGRLVLHSYTTNGGWYVRLSLGMFEMLGYKATGTTHFSPYSYDRHVPLAFYGAPFAAGTYLQRAAPVDIAATFAALLRVNQPSACVGRVVTEALKPSFTGPGAIINSRAA